MGASDPIGLTVDTASFRELFARSSQVQPKLRAALRRRIRDAAKGLAGEVQSEVGGRGEGLRAGIAAGIKVDVMTGAAREGVRIRSTGPLAQAWESSRGWRHPVFGHDVWVRQQGHPYFRRTIFEGRDKVREAVEAAMTEAVESLKGSV